MERKDEGKERERETETSVSVVEFTQRSVLFDANVELSAGREQKGGRGRGAEYDPS